MQLKHIKNISIGYSNPGLYALKPEQFEPAYYQQNNAITGTSSGRRTTWFVAADNNKEWVLRHYWRGGLMAKLSDDLYFFTGAYMSRPMLELSLLERMHQLGLPVPKPIAAKIERRGLFYRGDLLIERIMGAQDLHSYLTQQPMNDDLWQKLGQTIAYFHNVGVFHADLNIKNILLQQDKFYLIDFDRGQIKPPKAHWQQANLARLKRSFVKEQNLAPELHFSGQDWQQLLSGYQQTLRQY